MGVSHLAELLSRKKEFAAHRANLIFAAALHDIATPPFSHTSEHFLYDFFKNNHEAFAKDIILDSPELVRVITQFGGEVETVANLISGEARPLSDLINGTIDLDNSLRYGMSKGILLYPPYNPEQLVGGFGLTAGQLQLAVSQADLRSWENCRKEIYDHVYSQANLAPATMLYRAIELVYTDGELPSSFFFMTDDQAFDFLLHDRRARYVSQLMENLASWLFYPTFFSWESHHPNFSQQKLTSSWRARRLLASFICHEFGFEPQEVGVYCDRDKGYRQIHLPLVGDDGQIRDHQTAIPQKHMIKVFIHPKYEQDGDKIASFCSKILNESVRVGF
ncbi:HD domain-containing protein [Candidatus Daviesbacteria bacterium]|nr:HD domain-containing protein [Candidatus Daviesbacteria bacterium]